MRYASKGPYGPASPPTLERLEQATHGEATAVCTGQYPVPKAEARAGKDVVSET
ncbi:uncharacterized protein PGTG_21410 [Puccinia graminis f. sp. tritici CRL 75-36-700-3]|uniref:Uncharacterized protein n=1 Tax=Puccinia graminis f. sp. tritici (strain CRL 75-36-700-3 / race SCCL) TaxID=418459 RepID=H6QR89_PUCGT|nr:uncharacterized protein PGTG_21410 [Puccinia graminis f. sp. tritici CRL 75-36-700-3]EHS63071.1 hypothetical protein PGTG_21410 [Puccinia graminis f. sp. tritici CRL 75-36-700-3]